MTLDQWIIHGTVGVSSKTMWAAIKGVATKGAKKGGLSGYDTPYDLGDFIRCLNFVESCNITKSQLEKVKEVFPWWAPFIDNWDLIVDTYENELRHDTNELIREYEKEARRLAGWKQVSEGSWVFEKQEA